MRCCKIISSLARLHPALLRPSPVDSRLARLSDADVKRGLTVMDLTTWIAKMLHRLRGLASDMPSGWRARSREGRGNEVFLSLFFRRHPRALFMKENHL